MEVDFSGLLAAVTQHLLRGSDVIAFVDYTGGEIVSEHMRVDVAITMLFEPPPYHLAGEVRLLGLS